MTEENTTTSKELLLSAETLIKDYNEKIENLKESIKEKILEKEYNEKEIKRIKKELEEEVHNYPKILETTRAGKIIKNIIEDTWNVQQIIMNGDSLEISNSAHVKIYLDYIPQIENFSMSTIKEEKQ